METRLRSSKVKAPLVTSLSRKVKNAPLTTPSSIKAKVPLKTPSSVKTKALPVTPSVKAKPQAPLTTPSARPTSPLVPPLSSQVKTPSVTPSTKAKIPVTIPSPNKLEIPELVSLLIQNHCLFCLNKKIGTVYTINSASRQETDGYELLRRYFGVNTAESICHIFDAAAFNNKIFLSAEFPAPLLCQKCVDKLRELDEMHYKLEMVQQAILLNIRSTRKMIVNSFGTRKESSTSTSNENRQEMSERRQKFEMDILKRCDNDSGNKQAVLKILDDFYQTLLDETQDFISFPMEHLNQLFTSSPNPSIASDDDDNCILDFEVEDSFEAPTSPASCISINENENEDFGTSPNQSGIEEGTQSSFQRYTILIKQENTEDEGQCQALSSPNAVKEAEDGQKLSTKDAPVTTEIKNEESANKSETTTFAKTVFQSPSKSTPKKVETESTPSPSASSPSKFIPKQIPQNNQPPPALISPCKKLLPVQIPSFNKPHLDIGNARKEIKTVDVVIQRSPTSINITTQKDDKGVKLVKGGDNKLTLSEKNKADDTISLSPTQNPKLKRKLSESDGNNMRSSSGASPAKSVALNSPVKPAEAPLSNLRNPPKVVAGTSTSGYSSALGYSQVNEDDIVSDDAAPAPSGHATINSEASTSTSAGVKNEDRSNSESGSGSSSGSSSDDSENSSSEDSSSSDDEVKLPTNTKWLKPRDKGFIGPRLPPNYMRQRGDGRPKPYKCTECAYECCNLTRFKPHLLKVHGIEYQIKINRRTYLCDICGYSRDGERIGSFILHLESHETDVKSRSCSDCSQKFTTKQFYQLHQCPREGLTEEEATPTEDDKKDELMCRFCTLLCRGVNFYIKHIQTEHPGNDPYLCPICLLGFKHKDNLITHKINEHNAVKLKCRICEPTLEFSSRHEIFEHVNMNHHNFSLQCAYCPKKFIDKSRLRAHEVGHTKEKNYVCSQCGNVYTTSSTLKKHMDLEHSGGERQKFTCAHCSRVYTVRENLRKHLKAKHPTLFIT
ncbi:unnamed protein product [Orchesella dallaii]|uniref:C2H2-type domain-containing protein n=1 Tax=Orchesella dallaii TaxID=48710 RepID=A0ABP1PWK0_9HEXA